MTKKLWKSRNLVLTVLTAILRALSASAVGYLTAKDIPSETIEQVAAAIPAVGVLVFTVCWELIERRSAVRKAAFTATTTAAVLEKMGVNRV